MTATHWAAVELETWPTSEKLGERWAIDCMIVDRLVYAMSQVGIHEFTIPDEPTYDIWEDRFYVRVQG